MSALSTSVNELRTNDRQWRAFTTQGHCVVLAPPGSGKTKLLATRVAYDLVNKIPEPHGAACVTLTNAATEELRHRIESLGVPDRATMFTGTVHSFALTRIVIPFASLVGRPELAHASIANRAEERTAFDAALNSVYPRGTDRRSVQSTIEINRKRFASDEDWARHSDEVREVARRYSGNLHQRDLIDFIELIEIAVDFVEHHPIIRKALNARYPHLYVDEYQDLAPGLDRLVKELCFDYVTGSELFAVGDPDQAILAFTGTRPELLIELSQRPDVTPVHLQKNYRCGQEIIRVASFMKQGTSTVIGDRDGGHVSATHCPQGFSAQCVQAARRVQEVIQHGTPLHEIVAICPTNEQCETAANIFRQHAIPAFFRNNDHYRVTLVTSFIEGCAAWATLGREHSNYRLGSLLRQWRTILGQRWERESDVALTQLLIDFATRANEPAYQLMAELRGIGLAVALTRTPLTDDAIEITNMTRALTSGALGGLSVCNLAERARRINRVEITTMTSSKGLEFDVVLILGMDQKRVPFFASVSNPESMREERRKFYVSITRARNEVRLYYSGFVEWRNSIDPAGPSMFLSEIGLI
jgi:DNA helicase-2/ATP-dependent DNA helicase PcrA